MKKLVVLAAAVSLLSTLGVHDEAAGFLGAIKKGIKKAKKGIKKGAKKAKKGFSKGAKKAKKGFSKGRKAFSKGLNKVKKTGRGLTKRFSNGAKRALGKIPGMRKAGRFLSKGNKFVQGIRNKIKGGISKGLDKAQTWVRKGSQKLTRGAANWMKKKVGQGANWFAKSKLARSRLGRALQLGKHAKNAAGMAKRGIDLGRKAVDTVVDHQTTQAAAAAEGAGHQLVDQYSGNLTPSTYGATNKRIKNGYRRDLNRFIGKGKKKGKKGRRRARSKKRRRHR